MRDLFGHLPAQCRQGLLRRPCHGGSIVLNEAFNIKERELSSLATLTTSLRDPTIRLVKYGQLLRRHRSRYRLLHKH